MVWQDPLWQACPLPHEVHVPPLLPQAEAAAPLWQFLLASQQPPQLLLVHGWPQPLSAP